MSLYDFDDLDEQPEIFVFNDDQTTCIVASEEHSLLVNIHGQRELDLDQYFGISDIKRVIYFQNYFYILSNKRDQKLGIYLLKLPED